MPTGDFPRFSNTNLYKQIKFSELFDSLNYTTYWPKFGINIDEFDMIFARLIMELMSPPVVDSGVVFTPYITTKWTSI